MRLKNDFPLLLKRPNNRSTPHRSDADCIGQPSEEGNVVTHTTNYGWSSLSNESSTTIERS